MPRSAGEGILGYALLERHRQGVLAYLHYNRLREDVAFHKAPEGSLLAYAMVHEISHLLLDQNSHARSGVMMAHWSAREMVLIERGTLAFGGGEAGALRAGAAARAGGKASR